MAEQDESWQRLPEARIRMREGGLEILRASLQEGAFCHVNDARVQRVEDGILITIPTNVGRYGRIQFLGIDIFIPCDPDVIVPETEEEAADGPNPEETVADPA